MPKPNSISKGTWFTKMEDEIIAFCSTYYPSSFAERALAQIPGRTKDALQGRRTRIIAKPDYWRQLVDKAHTTAKSFDRKDLLNPHRQPSGDKSVLVTMSTLDAKLADIEARKTNDKLMGIITGDVNPTPVATDEFVEEKKTNVKQKSGIGQEQVTQVELGNNTFRIPVVVKGFEIENSQLFAVVELKK